MTGINTSQRISPYLFYEDVAAALDWLVATFGFAERFRLELPGGAVAHAEIGLGDGVVMLGNVGPRNLERPATVRASTYVFVDDVDGHHDRARAAGAEIVSAPAEQPFGDRIYLARDLEGHEWYFAQHVRDVALDDLRKQFGG